LTLEPERIGLVEMSRIGPFLTSIVLTPSVNRTPGSKLIVAP
jgi:hypothetical protein